MLNGGLTASHLHLFLTVPPGGASYRIKSRLLLAKIV